MLDRESDEFPQLANQLLVGLRSRDSENLQFTEGKAFRLIELIDVVVWFIFNRVTRGSSSIYSTWSSPL